MYVCMNVFFVQTNISQIILASKIICPGTKIVVKKKKKEIFIAVIHIFTNCLQLKYCTTTFIRCCPYNIIKLWLYLFLPEKFFITSKGLVELKFIAERTSNYV